MHRLTGLSPRLPLATLLALALTACGPAAPGPASEPPERALPVQILIVKPRDLSRSVQVSAPVESLRTVRLAAQTQGVVTRVAVEAGDRVAAGDIVAELDVREARAELAQALANLNEQQVSFERMGRLRSDGFIDEASYDVAAARVDSAAATVELWQTRVDFGRVAATLNGIVTERLVEPGEAVSQYSPLLSLADLDNLVVRFGLSELDVEALAPGLPVQVTIDALRSAADLNATIRRIMPTTAGPSRLVTVEVALPAEARERVRLGYLARARIPVDQRSGVLAVPLGAVAIGANGSYVMVVDERDTLVRREVETGPARGEWRQIVGGLETGEAVVTSNPADLLEGERVRIVSRLDEEFS